MAGIGPKLAEKIVAYRDENGPFRSRAALRKVPGLGPKAFEQAAGFLRVRGGENPLDASAIHPESYAGRRAAAEARRPQAWRSAGRAPHGCWQQLRGQCRCRSWRRSWARACPP